MPEHAQKCWESFLECAFHNNFLKSDLLWSLWLDNSNVQITIPEASTTSNVVWTVHTYGRDMILVSMGSWKGRLDLGLSQIRATLILHWPATQTCTPFWYFLATAQWRLAEPRWRLEGGNRLATFILVLNLHTSQTSKQEGWKYTPNTEGLRKL